MPPSHLTKNLTTENPGYENHYRKTLTCIRVEVIEPLERRLYHGRGRKLRIADNIHERARDKYAASRRELTATLYESGKLSGHSHRIRMQVAHPLQKIV
jgi:hypothetical protein